MGYFVNTIFWAVPVIALLQGRCEGSGDQTQLIQDALGYLEEMVNRMDEVLQDNGLYQDAYSQWSECSATCGIGFRWRHKIDCDTFIRDDCVEKMYCIIQPCPEVPKRKKIRHATCAMRPNQAPGTEENVHGVVTFEQEEKGSLIISINITGFDSRPSYGDGSQLEHGFHIHEYGDITGGCGSAGGHFNPKNVHHGDRLDSVRHVGDLGNIRQTPQGFVLDTIYEEKASLFGENSIIGRSLVIHRDQDDLGVNDDVGSQTTGNAGPRLACCVIGIAKGEE